MQSKIHIRTFLRKLFEASLCARVDLYGHCICILRSHRSFLEAFIPDRRDPSRHLHASFLNEILARHSLLSNEILISILVGGPCGHLSKHPHRQPYKQEEIRSAFPAAVGDPNRHPYRLPIRILIVIPIDTLIRTRVSLSAFRLAVGDPCKHS